MTWRQPCEELKDEHFNSKYKYFLMEISLKDSSYQKKAHISGIYQERIKVIKARIGQVGKNQIMVT